MYGIETTAEIRKTKHRRTEMKTLQAVIGKTFRDKDYCWVYFEVI